VPKACHTATLLDDHRLLVIGGQYKESPSHSLKFDGAVHILNLKTFKWTFVLNDATLARAAHTATMVDDKLYILGGRNGEFRSRDKLVYLSLKGGFKVHSIYQYGDMPKVITGHSAVSLGHHLLFFGGHQFKTLNTTLFYFNI